MYYLLTFYNCTASTHIPELWNVQIKFYGVYLSLVEMMFKKMKESENDKSVTDGDINKSG